MKTPINFNHKAETISKSLEISDERFEQMKEESFMIIMSCDNPSKIAEKLYNSWNEKEILCFATFHLSSLLDKMAKL